MQSYTWFFSLKSPLHSEQEAALERDFANFLDQWKSHGTPVEGMITIRYHRFIIVHSDPAQGRPSGCSIDSLKHAVTQILAHNKLDVIDAGNVFFQNPDGNIEYVHFSKIKKKVEAGALKPETLIFDHTLGQSDDLSKWKLPLRETWMKRYLNNTITR